MASLIIKRAFLTLLTVQYAQEAMQSFEPFLVSILTCVFNFLVSERTRNMEDTEKSVIYFLPKIGFIEMWFGKPCD